MKTAAFYLGTVLAAGTAAAGEWRVTRAITGDAPATTVVSVSLDDHAFANSLPDFADVRVLDGSGREVPRFIQARRDYALEERHTARVARLQSVEQLPEGGLAIVCLVDRTNEVSLTQVTLRTPLRNYEQTVTVYVQGAEGVWQPVKEAEPLYDYSRFADVKKETAALPALTNKLFRLVIGQADDRVFSAYASVTEETSGAAAARQTRRYDVEKRPFRIDAVIFRDTERVAVAQDERQKPVAASGVEVTEDKAHQTTVLTFDVRRQPVVGVVLDPAEQNFERGVTVECPVPGGWRTVAQGRVSRVRLPGVTRQENVVGLSDVVRAERLRVRVRNDDNPPLTFGEGCVAYQRMENSVLFIADKGQAYRLSYGNPEVAAAPVYEQGVTAYLRAGHPACEWRLAPPPEGAVVYQGGVRLRQFIARHGVKLISVLVMAVLGLLVLRAARHVER